MAPEIMKGLKDVYLDTTESSFIDGQEGKLLYRGYNIHDLAEKSNFEEVIYLLLYPKLSPLAQGRTTAHPHLWDLFAAANCGSSKREGHRDSPSCFSWILSFLLSFLSWLRQTNPANAGAQLGAGVVTTIGPVEGQLHELGERDCAMLLNAPANFSFSSHYL